MLSKSCGETTSVSFHRILVLSKKTNRVFAKALWFRSGRARLKDCRAMTLTRTNIRFTASGMEVPAVTAEQMREVDRVAMQETGPNLFQMMENAGRNLAALSMELLGNGWQQASYLVLAGSGGNGGGGICAARHLANHGCRVSLCLADPEHLGEVPAFQYEVFRSTSGKE